MPSTLPTSGYDLKLSALVNEARGILADRKTTMRYSDDDLVRYANDAFLLLVKYKPELFLQRHTLECVAGHVQWVNPIFCRAVVAIDNIDRTTRDTLDRITPDWMSTPTGPATNWAPHEGEPSRFYIYPPSAAGQELQITIIQPPDVLTAASTFPLNYEFWPPIVDYVVAMAESRDDPSVLNQRASQFLSKFGVSVMPPPAAA